MLVLSRRAGESIVIDGQIVITLVQIGRGRVQVGIDAPPHVSVHREEIFQRIVARNEANLPLPGRTLVATR